MSVASDKKRVMITLSPSKIREFKVKAAQVDMTLSQYLSAAGSVVTSPQISKNSLTNSSLN